MIEVREDLRASIAAVVDWFGEPGTWLVGEQRTTIVEEARAARACRLCQKRKLALSPASVDGSHESANNAKNTLHPLTVDVVHRLATDSARLTESWITATLGEHIDDGMYVEIVGLVATSEVVDTFTTAIGESPPKLPSPRKGRPSRFRHPSARLGEEWVPTVDPPDTGGPLETLYGGRSSVSPIVRALTLVPDTARAFLSLVRTMYLDGKEVRNWGDVTSRALTRPQIELLAARTSMLNECFY